jgi:hypothetical protein
MGGERNAMMSHAIGRADEIVSYEAGRATLGRAEPLQVGTYVGARGADRRHPPDWTADVRGAVLGAVAGVSVHAGRFAHAPAINAAFVGVFL